MIGRPSYHHNEDVKEAGWHYIIRYQNDGRAP